MTSKHKVAYRHFLPHIDRPGLYQGVTFRLNDSLPKDVLRRMIENPDGTQNDKQRERLETLSHAGYGKCWLAHPDVAQIFQDVLLFHDKSHYDMVAWAIMPNHVHVLVRVFEGYPLFDVIRVWKSYSALKINRLVGRCGRLWDHGYYDRYMRDEHHMANAIRYIHENPVKAGLVERPEDWQFSSIHQYKLT